MPSDTKAPADAKPTVTVSDSGDIAAGTPRGSYRQGFAQLLDFAAPPARITVLPPGAPTEIGFARTGQSLRDAMAMFAGSGSVNAGATISAAAKATIGAVASVTATAQVMRRSETAPADEAVSTTDSGKTKS